MLPRVVAEVFDGNSVVEEATSSDDLQLDRPRVTGELNQGRAAHVRSSYEWVDVFIPELNVQTTLFGSDDVEQEKGR
jgi:activator of HSP90 ATPase